MAKTKDSLNRRRAMTGAAAPPCLILLLPVCGEYNLDPHSLRDMLVAAASNGGAEEDPTGGGMAMDGVPDGGPGHLSGNSTATSSC